MPKIRTESDELRKEYAQLAERIQKLYYKYGGEKAQPAVQQILTRMDEIVDAIEECTGIKTRYTKEEILDENKRIQES